MGSDPKIFKGEALNGSKYLRIKKILAAQRPKFLRFESEDSGKTVFLSGLGAG